MNIMRRKSNLVLGMGEVGTAIYNVLSRFYDTEAGDIDFGSEKQYDVIHICYPYSDNFIFNTLNYQLRNLNPQGTMIIHSTVPVSTTRKFNNAVHSPIRGVHPRLEMGIHTFVKFFGSVDRQKAEGAAMLFDPICKTKIAEKPEDTEAMKLWCTTQYGLMIVLEKAIKRYCDTNGLDFDVVYTHGNETYNEGYDALGMRHVMRPVLKHVDGPIGGHCVMPNLELLEEGDVTGFIKRMNMGAG